MLVRMVDDTIVDLARHCSEAFTVCFEESSLLEVLAPGLFNCLSHILFKSFPSPLM